MTQYRAAQAGPEHPPGPVPLPRYTSARVAVCPVTGADLETEFDGFWCHECQELHPFCYVVHPGDIDDDDD